MKKKLWATLCVVLILTVLAVSFTACKPKTPATDNDINPLLDLSKEVNLVLAGGAESWPEVEKVISKFEKKYSNCTVRYEFIESYSVNFPERIKSNENKVDIFTTTNIIPTSNQAYLKDYSVNLLSEDAKKYLDLSDTNKGLVKNFRYSAVEDIQYAIPYGGEMRGLYVNKTLLAQHDLAVPTNWDELMHCCEVLLAADLIPFHSSPDIFAQQLLYPYVCNTIVNGGNYEEDYQAIENIDDGISELFRPAYAKIYEITQKNYYNYKLAEQQGYSYSGTGGKAMDFFGIKKNANNAFEKLDDVGTIAFMPSTQAAGLDFEETKKNYHSNIEYEFITAPVGDEGGYGYLSPSSGMGVNKNSDNVDWALEFLDFLFSSEINKEFAEEMGIIPNTVDAMLKYNVPANRACTVGDMTFSYGFYDAVITLMTTGYSNMVGISKMNAPKYLKNGEIAFTLDQYVERLEQEFQAIKQARTGGAS